MNLSDVERLDLPQFRTMADWASSEGTQYFHIDTTQQSQYRVAARDVERPNPKRHGSMHERQP